MVFDIRDAECRLQFAGTCYRPLGLLLQSDHRVACGQHVERRDVVRLGTRGSFRPLHCVHMAPGKVVSVRHRGLHVEEVGVLRAEAQSTLLMPMAASKSPRWILIHPLTSHPKARFGLRAKARSIIARPASKSPTMGLQWRVQPHPPCPTLPPARSVLRAISGVLGRPSNWCYLARPPLTGRRICFPRNVGNTVMLFATSTAHLLSRLARRLRARSETEFMSRPELADISGDAMVMRPTHPITVRETLPSFYRAR
jgi:hypothetical protein